MTSDHIANILARYPTLAHIGIGVAGQDGTRLLESAEICTEVCRWLSWIAPIKSINPRRNSYGLKHLVGEAIGTYVSNGELIVAAIHRGFPMRVISAPNAKFGMSERSLRLAEQQKCPAATGDPADAH